MNCRLSPVILVPFILTFLASGCREVNVEPSDLLAQKLIVGTWEWDRTYNPWGGEITTPQSEGYTRKLVYTKEGKVRIYRNDSLQNEFWYAIYSCPDDFLNPDGPKVLRIGHYSSDTITSRSCGGPHVFLRADTLLFMNSYLDGSDYWYVRTR